MGIQFDLAAQAFTQKVQLQPPVIFPSQLTTMKRRHDEEKSAVTKHHNDQEGFEREAEMVIQYEAGESHLDHHSIRRKVKLSKRSEQKPLPKLAVGSRKKEQQSKQERRLKQSTTARKEIPASELTTSLVRQPDMPLFQLHDRNPASSLPKDMRQTKRAHEQPRFPRVPIVRIEEPSAVYSLIVYRGMEPRTADRFFNFLKDVDYMAPMGHGHTADRLKEPISFNSKFECGNLNYAMKVTSSSRPDEYNLHIRVDTNTQGHRQWYFFSVWNRRKQGGRAVYRFNVYRFSKKLSLYLRGMRPYAFSKRDLQIAVENNNGICSDFILQNNWKQISGRVRYWLDTSETNSRLYVLSFDYQFKYEGDQVFFAACPPYSYTYLMKRVQGWPTQPSQHHSLSYSTELLARSICGLEVPVLTLSTNVQWSEKKRYVVILARSHPGESAGSWVADGLLEWLQSSEPKLHSLLSRVVVKVVPMMNPDGVFMGNYRTGVTGKDINRCFYSGRESLFPEIAALRDLISQLQESGEVVAVIDLHGHSILKNSFVFGPSKNFLAGNPLRRLPEQLAQKCPIFKYDNCRFLNEKSKIETARVYFQLKHHILSFTIENSLGLWRKHEDGRTYPILIKDWRELGKKLGQSLSDLLVGGGMGEPETHMLDHSRHAYFSNQLITHKKIKHVREELSVQLTPQLRNYENSNQEGQKTNEESITSHHSEEQPKLRQSTVDDQGDNQASTKLDVNAFSKKTQAFEMEVDPIEYEANPDSEIPDNFSEGYEEDQNDQDSDSQDLPDELLLPILRAIEAKDYNLDSYRTVSTVTKKNEDKCTGEVIKEEILRNRRQFHHRNTNCFKEMKLSIKKLAPGQVRQLPAEPPQQMEGNSIFNDSYVNQSAWNREPSQMMAAERHLGRSVIKDIYGQRSRSYHHNPTGLTSTMARMLHFEKQIMEQVSHEIDSRIKQLSDRPKSIFSKKVLVEEMNARPAVVRNLNSPTYYPRRV